MAEVRLTKNELRTQQGRLSQLLKYLPTLQLKKAMLQAEVHEARIEISHAEKAFQKSHEEVDRFAALLTDQVHIDPKKVVEVAELKKRYENIAGVEVPYFEKISFHEISYDLFDSPPWVDSAIKGLQALAEASVKVGIAREKRAALEKELREVSIRVNLFEKILIPRAKKNIKKIKVFLGDLELAAVSRAKVAKGIIEEQKLIKAGKGE